MDWGQATRETNIQKLEECVDLALDAVSNFTVPFMEAYLTQINKQTKSILNAPPDGLEEKYKEIANKYKAFRTKMKQIHTAQKGDLPEDFKVDAKPLKRKKKQNKAATSDVAASFQNEQDEPKKVNAVSETLDSSHAGTETQKQTPSALDKKKEAVADNIEIPRKKSSERTSSVENQQQKPTDSKPAAPTRAAAPPPKPERKAFSLGTLMKREPKSQVSVATKESQLPTWLYDSPDGEAPTDEVRSLALEFLREMACQFPTKGVNAEAVALHFEKALDSWAKTKEDYWKRLHSIVAAISGKHGSGTLVHLIVDGKFSSADQVVQLSDDDLLKSYEGQAII
jgi:hypothetical protein